MLDVAPAAVAITNAVMVPNLPLPPIPPSGLHCFFFTLLMKLLLLQPEFSYSYIGFCVTLVLGI